MIILFLLLTTLAALYLVAVRFCYRLVFYNENQHEQDPYVIPPGKQHEQAGEKLLALVAQADSLAYEQVYITAHDGLRLAGRYYHNQDGAAIQIQFHGYRSSALRDLCAWTLLARKLGYNVLLVDQRAHGKSEGHTIAFGTEERLDCLDWIAYASARFGKTAKIVLVGLSMGASTVLMAADLNLPDTVVSMIADCPYSAPDAILKKILKKLKFPLWLSYPAVAIGGLVYGKVRIWKGSAVKSVQHSQTPILLIHGEADYLVPCEMSREIYAACKTKKSLITFPNAGHGLSYLLDPVRYERVVADFLRDCGL